MDTDTVKKFLTENKIVVFLVLLGIVFLFAAIILLFKYQNQQEPIVFMEKSASNSANLNQIQVDIEGAVVKPGVYTFASDSRISDALSAAGGFLDSADQDWLSKNLNKAAKLTDGGKVYIPAKGEPKSDQTQLNNNERTLGVTTGLININSASLEQLEQLSGVGPVTAEKIINLRPYGSIDELKSKKAVGTALFEKIKNEVTL